MLRGLRDITGLGYGLSGMACAATLRSEPIRTVRLWGLQRPSGSP